MEELLNKIEERKISVIQRLETTKRGKDAFTLGYCSGYEDAFDNVIELIKSEV